MEYREATRLVFSEQIRERARRHRKSTNKPNDFSHKPKTTLRVRGYLLGFRRALRRAQSCSSWQKGSHDIGYAPPFYIGEKEGRDSSLCTRQYSTCRSTRIIAARKRSTNIYIYFCKYPQLCIAEWGAF